MTAPTLADYALASIALSLAAPYQPDEAAARMRRHATEYAERAERELSPEYVPTCPECHHPWSYHGLGRTQVEPCLGGDWSPELCSCQLRLPKEATA